MEDQKALIYKRTMDWFRLWSPKDQPMNFEGVHDLFASEEQGLYVVDGFEGGVVVLTSPESYKEKWMPMMNATFSYYEIAPIGAIKIEVDGNLATAIFEWKANARLKDGSSIPLGQYATHIWKYLDGKWKIVHEHLTNAGVGNWFKGKQIE